MTVRPGLIRPIRSSRLYEGVTEIIYDLILEGYYQPDDSLPSEGELCKLFVVSRTCLRPALRTLGAPSLVTTKNVHRTYVSKDSPENLGDTLSMMLFHDINNLDLIYEARRMLESWTAFFAASRITDEDLAKLGDLVREQDAEVRKGDSGIDADFRFHLTIGRAARNENVTRLLYLMIMLVLKALDLAKCSPHDLRDAVKQHARIVETLRIRIPLAAMEEI